MGYKFVNAGGVNYICTDTPKVQVFPFSVIHHISSDGTTVYLYLTDGRTENVEVSSAEDFVREYFKVLSA